MPINVVLKNNQSRLNVSTRVLVRPIGLDMVEVDGSIKCDCRSIWHRAPQARSPQGQNRLKPVLGNPPGPIKLLNFFFFETVRVKIQLEQSWYLNLKEKQDDRQ